MKTCIDNESLEKGVFKKLGVVGQCCILKGLLVLKHCTNL